MIQLDRWLQKQKQTKSNIRPEKQKADRCPRISIAIMKHHDQ